MNFEITENRGFKITFPNGLILSTQFGPGNYGTNHDASFFTDRREGFEATQVEIAVFKASDRDFLTRQVLGHDDDVKGYVDINEWLEIVDKVKNYDTGKEVRHSPP
jgi:hypothetical protein